VPKAYHPFVDYIPEDELRRLMKQRREEIARVAESMPAHQGFIERFCLGQAA
jgi:tryptophan halogenase